jgi:hypothetical protein
VRSVPSGLLTAVQDRGFHWADLVKITLVSGTVYRLTGLDQDVTVAFAGDAPALFLAGHLVSAGTYSAKIGTTIDESEMRLILDSGSPPVVVADDIRRGFWNGAVVDVGFCDWSNVALTGYGAV